VHSIQDPEVVEKRALPVDDQILAIQYQKDDSKYQEEEEHGDRQPEENATVSHSTENNGTSSKRKSLDDVARVPEIKRKKLKVTNSGKHIDEIKKTLQPETTALVEVEQQKTERCPCSLNVHQCQDQSGSKKLMSSSIDIETKKTLQPETGSLVEVEQQKTERYYLNSYVAMPDIIFALLLFEK